MTYAPTQVQMCHIFESRGYHVELLHNSMAYDHGNCTNRGRVFVLAYRAKPGETLQSPLPPNLRLSK